MTIWRSNSMFCVLSLNCIDVFLPPLLLNSPLSKALVPRNIGSCEVEQHFLNNQVPRSIWFAIVRSVPLLFTSRPEERPMNDREGIFQDNFLNVFELFSHYSSFPLTSHTMSFNIDMKIILSVKFSGSHCNSPIIF